LRRDLAAAKSAANSTLALAAAPDYAAAESAAANASALTKRRATILYRRK
jgi:hypothetical protein